MRDYEVYKTQMIRSLRTFPWQDRHAVGDYLAQTYYYVRHSEKFLALAAALLKEEDRSIQKRFFKHLGEENSHDLMVKKDLENIGFTLSDFPERPETKIFWETQYYKIEHEDPTSLMGYILLLEEVACDVCLWMSQEIGKFHKKGTTFLRVHGEEDPGHVEEAVKLIRSLNDERQERIFSNLIQSQISYTLMIRAIVEDHVQVAVKKSA